MREDRKTVFTDVEMLSMLLEQGQVCDNIGLLLGGIEKKNVEKW